MKKIFIGALLTLATASVATTYASSGEVSKEIQAINQEITSVASGITLSSAPAATSSITSNNIAYTPWELIHRTPMMQGFVWTGSIANFITPEMFIGTPFSADAYLGINNPNSASLSSEAIGYKDCLEKEYFTSFGLGQRVETSDIAEMTTIAKSCAKTFYGKYFDGKPYTTREEFLMSLFTLFGENVRFSGKFSEDGRYTASGTGVMSGYSNVSPRTWYSPYLQKAREIGMIEGSSTWSIAQKVSDADVVDMMANYTAYRMNYTGETLDRGIIVTEKNRYNVTFTDAKNLTIRIQ